MSDDDAERASALAQLDLAATERARALALYDLAQYRLSVVAFRRALALAPGHAPSHARLAYALDALGLYDEALAEIVRAIALGPEDEWYHRLHSYILSRLDRDGEALVAARKAVELKPNWVVTLARLTYAAAFRGPIDEAMKAADEAVRIGPRDIRGLNARARALSATGDPDAAITAYQRALAVEPDNAYAVSELARLSVGELAVTRARAAIANDPANNFSRRNLVDKLLAVRRYQEAVEAAREALAHDADAHGYTTLVRALIAAGRAGEARRTSAAGVLACPASPHAFHAVALAAAALGDTAAVRAAVVAGLGCSRVAHGLYGVALLHVDNALATEVATAYRARDPGDTTWIHSLALSRARDGRIDEALALARTSLDAPTAFSWETITEIAATGGRGGALADLPDKLPRAGQKIVNATRGNAARARREWDEAARLYTAANAPRPYCCALYGLAVCDFARGDIVAATAHIARASEAGPECVSLSRHDAEKVLARTSA